MTTETTIENTENSAPVTAVAAYETDLTEAEWSALEAVVPKPKPRVNLRHERRAIVNALLHKDKSRCSWRQLPKDLPDWQSVYHYFRMWTQDGTWAKITTILVDGGRKLETTPAPAVSGVNVIAAVSAESDSGSFVASEESLAHLRPSGIVPVGEGEAPTVEIESLPLVKFG